MCVQPQLIELEGDYYPRPPKVTQEEYDKIEDLRERKHKLTLRLHYEEISLRAAKGLRTRYCNIIDKMVVAAYQRSGDHESLKEYGVTYD
jgi:hypothetical protein